MISTRGIPPAVLAAAGVGGVLGVALAALPAAISRRVAGPGDPVPPALVRTLGLRMAAQAAAELATPQRRVLWSGACVDLAHGASMLAAGSIWPRYRRSAAISAALAFAVGAGQFSAGWVCR